MPQFIKTVRGSEVLLEVLLDGVNVYVAEGTRSSGTKSWTLNQNSPSARRFDDADEARAFYEKKVAVPKTWTRASDDAPHAAAFRDRLKADKAALDESLDDAEVDHGGGALLEKTGVVNWVRRPESRRPKDEFWQLTLTDTTLVARTGKLGTKGRQLEKTKHKTRAEALKYADIKMRTAYGFLEFGPPA